MSEKVLQARIIKYFKENGFFVRKWHQGRYAGRGMPDIHALKNGKAFYIEVKCPGKKPTPIQLHTMEQLKQHGGVVFWVDSFKKFLTKISEIDSV